MCERNGEIERQRERERETEGEQKTASGLAGLGHERSRFFIVGSFVVISCWFRLKQVEGAQEGSGRGGKDIPLSSPRAYSPSNVFSLQFCRFLL